MAKKTKTTAVANTITLKNDDLGTLISWLSLPLHSEKASARNRIVKLLQAEGEIFDNVRQEALEKHKITKDGKAETWKDDKGKTFFKLKDDAKWAEEYQKLSLLPVTFDVLPSNRESWRIVRSILADTKNEMDVPTTDWWESVLVALKNV